VLAWGPSNDARAVAVDGGYRIDGTWSFGSGCATWLGGYCPIQGPDGKTRRRPDGTPDGRTMPFPAAQATIVPSRCVARVCRSKTGTRTSVIDDNLPE
jgi:hypothetical protein